MNELVSVITPAYNSEKFIAETIQSVQNQTHPHWEMIIIDDASTDDTFRLISELSQSDSRIKVIRLSSNQGTGISRNTGIGQAKGRYIAFLDADDLWKPEKLEKQLSFMTQNNLPFTYSFYDCIDEEGKSINIKVQSPTPLSYSQLFFCNYVGNLTAIYDTAVFGKIPIESVRKRQDWMLWLTILKKIKKAHPVAEHLATYRIRKQSVSSSKIELLKHNFLVYLKFHKNNCLVSAFYMIIFLLNHFLIKPRYTEKVKA